MMDKTLFYPFSSDASVCHLKNKFFSAVGEKNNAAVGIGQESGQTKKEKLLVAPPAAPPGPGRAVQLMTMAHTNTVVLQQATSQLTKLSLPPCECSDGIIFQLQIALNQFHFPVIAFASKRKRIKRVSNYGCVSIPQVRIALIMG